MDSLLPILAECVPQNAKNTLTTVTVPQQPQTLSDELILPPILVLKLQMTKSPPAVPYHITPVGPQPSTSTAADYQSKPISLEGVINIKKYKKYLYKPPH